MATRLEAMERDDKPIIQILQLLPLYDINNITCIQFNGGFYLKRIVTILGIGDL